MSVHSSDREAWLAARNALITASDVGAIMGHNEYRSRAEVINEKMGLGEAFAGNERTELGLALEPWIAEQATKRYGWPLVAHGSLIFDPECPDLGATPDYTMSTPWGDATVQIKASTVREYETVKKYGGQPPLNYQLQVQAELACLGYQHGVLLVFHTASLCIRAYYLPRHDGAIASIREAAREAMDTVRAYRKQVA